MEKDLQVIKNAADSGDDRAMSIYASCCEENKDYEAAEKYYKMAADNGLVPAMNHLSLLYFRLGEKEKSHEYFMKAVRAGDLDAIYDYARVLETEDNLDEALKLYMDAAANGVIHAFYDAARIYRYKGSEEDLKTAAILLNIAAENGYLPAMEKLSYCFSNGTGVEKDEEKAKYWYDRFVNCSGPQK